jgi:hypothetical protein|tara:strand:+ start:1153 stop:1749 length:597 start_codon:yes stop_codon:yes gene_type:complete
MPYAKEELSKIGFYTDYIDKLRSTYISELINRAKSLFRDDNDVLYSFEDISTSLGIEDAVLNQNPEYSTLQTELNRTNIEELGYSDFKDLIEKESCSVQKKLLTQTRKDQNSDKLVDRLFSELVQIEVADPLPDGLENGDTITSDNVDDVRKWLIDGNQKRPFPDLQSFYAIGTAEWRKVKTRSLDVIDSIPEGEPVD